MNFFTNILREQPVSKKHRNITIGVGVVVVQDRQLLTLRRIGGHWPDQLALVGGHPEEMETVYNAAIRETEEETGLIVVPKLVNSIHIFHTQEHIHPETGYHHFSVYVAADVVGGTLENREPQKHKDLRFLTYEGARAVSGPVCALIPFFAIEKIRDQIGL